MLVLMLWTGGLAHAAEQASCIPATAELAAHYEGDGDEGRSDGDQGIAHHHTGCSGHQLAATAAFTQVSLQSSTASVPLSGRQRGMHGYDPECELRPPIA